MKGQGSKFVGTILYFIAGMLVYYYIESGILIGWLKMSLLHFWGSVF